MANQNNNPRYKPLPRTSEESIHNGNIIEDNENAPLHRDDGQSMVEDLGLQGDKHINIKFRIKYNTLSIFRFFIVVSVISSLATLIVESIRLDLGIRHGLGKYRDGMREYTAPIIAFSSFDILVHSIVVLYYALKHYCHIAIVSTESSSMHADVRQARSSSKQSYEIPQILVRIAYLVELSIIIALLVGLLLDIRFTYRIPHRLIGQVCGWVAVGFRVASLTLWPATKIQRFPIYSAQQYGERLEDGGKPQSLRVSQEQRQPLI